MLAYETSITTQAEVMEIVCHYYYLTAEEKRSNMEFRRILIVVYHILWRGSNKRASGTSFDTSDIAHTAFLKVYASAIIAHEKSENDFCQKLALNATNEHDFLQNLTRYLMCVISSVQHDLFKGKYIQYNVDPVLTSSKSLKAVSYDNVREDDNEPLLDMIGYNDSLYQLVEENTSVLNECLNQCDNNKIMAGILIRCMKACHYSISKLKVDVLHGEYRFINLNLNLMIDMKLVSQTNAKKMIESIRENRDMGFYYLQELAGHYINSYCGADDK